MVNLEAETQHVPVIPSCCRRLLCTPSPYALARADSPSGGVNENGASSCPSSLLVCQEIQTLYQSVNSEEVSSGGLEIAG